MLANDIPSFVHVWQVNAAENARKSHEYRFKTNNILVLDIAVIVLRGIINIIASFGLCCGSASTMSNILLHYFFVFVV